MSMETTDSLTPLSEEGTSKLNFFPEEQEQIKNREKSSGKKMFLFMIAVFKIFTYGFTKHF